MISTKTTGLFDGGGGGNVTLKTMIRLIVVDRVPEILISLVELYEWIIIICNLRRNNVNMVNYQLWYGKCLSFFKCVFSVIEASYCLDVHIIVFSTKALFAAV